MKSLAIVILFVLFVGCNSYKTPTNGKPTSTNSSSEQSIVANSSPTLPSAADCKKLSNRTLELLADAVAKSDFTLFYENISKRWQSQISKDDLKKAFKSFIDNQIDIISAQSAKNSFVKEPYIDAQNTLNFDIRYELVPMGIVSNQRYIQESGAWKLIGLSVNFK